MIGCRRWPRNSLAGQWLSPLRPAASPPRWRPRPQPRPFRFVFSIGGDPIKQGLAASFNRPGGNSTGITLLTNQLEPKRLGLLRQLVPQATTIGFLLNPSYPPSEGQLKDAEEAARAMSQQIHILRADTDDEIDAAFQTVTQQGIAALAVAAAPFFDTR